MKLARILSVVTVLLASTTTTRADVLYVDPLGAPGGYLSVQAAVDAASSGDTILVVGRMPLDGFVVDGKGLSILSYESDGVLFDSPIECRNVPAGELLLLSGLEIDLGVPAPFVLRLAGNAGSVRVEQCSILGHTQVVDSFDVAFVRSEMRARITNLSWHPSYDCIPQSNGIDATNSDIAFFESSIYGDAPCCDGPGTISLHNGLYFQGAGSLFCSGSDFHAGSPTSNCGCDNCPSTSGGDGIHFTGAAIARITDSLFYAGARPWGEYSGFFQCVYLCYGAESGVGMDLAPLTDVLVAPNTQHLRFSAPPIVAPGDSVPLRFVGAPGDDCRLRVSTTGDFSIFQYPNPGARLLAPGWQEYVIGTIPAGGELNASWTAPTLAPGETESTLLLQAAFPSGTTPRWRSPSTLTILSTDPTLPYNDPPVRFCGAVPNSTGLPALMGAAGSTSVAANDLVLRTQNTPPGHNGLYIYSPDQASLPLGDGVLCLGNTSLGFVLRLPGVVSDFNGLVTYPLDNTSPPHSAGLITPGSTWNFSLWYRDVPAANTGFNFSDGLQITFLP